MYQHNLLRVLRAHVPLSRQQAVYWYRSKGGDVQRLGRSGVELAVRYTADNNGSNLRG